jgi:site-specific recombinase XerD
LRDRVVEARALYLKYRGQQNVVGEKSWEAVILEDFAEFQKAGLTHPLMANAGHDTRALQAWLGHKNIQHTVRYTELAPDRFKDFWR